jgi:hypothetical protein
MNKLVMLAALAPLAFTPTLAFANHKAGHQLPPGFEKNLSRNHANTVNTNAGCGNGGEAFNTYAPLPGEQHEFGNADADPGNSESNNNAGENCN